MRPALEAAVRWKAHIIRELTHDVEVIIQKLLVVRSDVKRNAEGVGRVDSADESREKTRMVDGTRAFCVLTYV